MLVSVSKKAIETESYNLLHIVKQLTGLPCDSVVKNPPANEGDEGSVPGLGKVPGEGNGNPLQCSCLENLMDRGACGLLSMGSQRARHD